MKKTESVMIILEDSQNRWESKCLYLLVENVAQTSQLEKTIRSFNKQFKEGQYLDMGYYFYQLINKLYSSWYEEAKVNDFARWSITQLKILFSEGCLWSFEKTINLNTGLSPESKAEESSEIDTPPWLMKV